MDEKLLTTAAAESVIEMGYNKSAVRMAIVMFREQSPTENFNAQNLLEIILEKEDKGELPPPDDSETSNEEENPTASRDRPSNTDSSVCKGCNRKEREILCRHCIRCERCTDVTRICAACYSKLK